MDRTVTVHSRPHDALHIFRAANVASSPINLTSDTPEIAQHAVELIISTPADKNFSACAGWEECRYPFSRLFDRFFMISGIILFFACRPLLKIGSLNQLGLTPRTEAARNVAVGAAFAIVSMASLVMVMSLTDVFVPFFR